MAKAPDNVHYYGIRHHGPGSAACLIEALDALQPAVVLIEGPSDATPVLPMLALPTMRPPVALLCYPEDDPANTSFWPFAVFSPEYQATLWAVRHKLPVRFIDLPSSVFQAREPDTPKSDPIGMLASAAGYEDAESWWSDLIEQNPAPGPVFAALADAMATLREEETALSEFEARREAHMRLAIAAAQKEFEGTLAVVCGAWHVPALKQERTRKEDTALLGSLPRKKANITWAPWTSPRLANALGYGAGVAAPGWYAHLWQTRHRHDSTSLWLAQIAHLMRRKGHLISTASLIEAERLSLALASIRGRPRAGFEELREASIACLFNGEALLWQTVADELLLGNEVGAIPDEVPLAPLIEDLQRQQKLARLKPEALDSEIALDLRSDSGLFRSTLLHRLGLLGVHWGRLLDSGSSRGTFRERWQLAWQPEFAVQLVEKLVYGATIAQAANGYLTHQLNEAAALDALAELIHAAITADLPEAAAQGLQLFEARSAHSGNCREILAAIPPLADLVRYGQARTIDTVLLNVLLERLIVEAAINLMFAARALDAEAAEQLAASINAAHAGVRLIEAKPELLEQWFAGLRQVLEDAQATPYIAGCVAQILYNGDQLTAEEAVRLLERRLSPGTTVANAAGFFAGFFAHEATHLIYDEGLRVAVDRWLLLLPEDEYVAHLPLLRRVFSRLDAMERKRLITAVLGRGTQSASGLTLASGAEVGWQEHFEVLQKLFADPEVSKS